MFVKNSIPFHLYFTLSYIDQQVDSSSKGVLAEIRKMQQSINNFVEPQGMKTLYQLDFLSIEFFFHFRERQEKRTD